MKNNIIRMSIIATLLCFLLSACSKKSEYYISLSKSSNIQEDSVSELSDNDVELIKEFIPKIVTWYNSIDISTPQPVDFVTEEVDALGNKLFDSDAWDKYISNFSKGLSNTEEEKLKYNQIRYANAIYGQIATIMMTNDTTSTLYGEKSESTILVNKDSWIELGDIIKESIKYYYK